MMRGRMLRRVLPVGPLPRCLLGAALCVPSSSEDASSSSPSSTISSSDPEASAEYLHTQLALNADDSCIRWIVDAVRDVRSLDEYHPRRANFTLVPELIH